MDNTDKTILEQLFSLQDKKYREFQSKLLPTIDQEKVIGIKTPLLRKLAKELTGSEEAESFLLTLPHYYYEENNLHAFLIENIKDYDRALRETKRFLPYVDNWATCDCFSPKVFKKHTEELLESVYAWLNSKQAYTIRYGIGMLMRYYLDDDFKKEYLDLVCDIDSQEYYVNMMRAWYFATALAKKPDETLPFFKEKRLDAWTHNKAIQKALESYRVDSNMKNKLRKLRI